MADLATTTIAGLDEKTSLLNTDLVLVSDPVNITDNKITVSNLTTTLISSDVDNALTTGADGRLTIVNPTPSDFNSADADNLLTLGADSKLKADADTFISGDASNVLVKGTDEKLYVAPASLAITNGLYIRGNGTGFDEVTGSTITGDLLTATETVKGVIEIASDAEVKAGTNTLNAIVPSKAQLHPSSAKAWVNFNGTGTVSIRDSYNIASLTDAGVGDQFVTFTNNFANTDYAVVSHHAGGSVPLFANGYNPRTVSTYGKRTIGWSGSSGNSAVNIDSDYVTHVFYGELA